MATYPNRTIRVVVSAQGEIQRSPFGDQRDYTVLTIRRQSAPDQKSGFAAQRHEGRTGREFVASGSLEWWEPATVGKLVRLALDQPNVVRPNFGIGYLCLDVEHYGPIAISYQAIDGYLSGLRFRPAVGPVADPYSGAVVDIDSALDLIAAEHRLEPLVAQTPEAEA